MTYQREFRRWLRVGVVGLGSHAYRNILPALHHLPVRLVALCDRDAALLERTAVEYGVSALYTDAERMYAEAGLDAVLLCAGPEHHPALATRAFAAGLLVWMERPPAMNAAGVEAMQAAAGGRVCAVGFKKTAMPAARKAQDLLARPEFGRLRSLLAIYPVAIPRDGDKALASGELSQWLSVGCHPLSLMMALGGPVTAVTTLRDTSDSAEAVGVVYLDYASGASGVLHLAGGAPGGFAGERYELFGEGQAIRLQTASASPGIAASPSTITGNGTSPSPAPRAAASSGRSRTANRRWRIWPSSSRASTTSCSISVTPCWRAAPPPSARWSSPCR